MSEATHKLRRMLSLAQRFAQDTPLEALARARTAVSEARAALQQARDEDEREELAMLLDAAEQRVAKYDVELQAWSQSVRARADLYNQHERQRIEQPIPAKV